jgi:hypothetical protein
MAGDYWDDLRSLVNTWAANVPPTARRKIVGMLRSGTDGQFEAGFFELYLHETLIRSGYDVQIEPTLAHTDRRPDFLASRAGERLYVECTTISANRTTLAKGKRFAPLQAALNRLTAPGVVLRIELLEEGDNVLPEGRLRDRIAKWLATLEVDSLPELGDRHCRVRPFEWIEDGWDIRLHPSQLAPGSSARNASRVLTIGPVYTAFVDDSGAVRRALTNKGTAYGSLGDPLIVAINAASGWPADDDVLDALYGGVQLPINHDGSLGNAFRGPGGYWWSGDQPRHQGVSGVLVVKGLNPWSACDALPTLWLNPSAEHPVDPLAPWRSCRIVDHDATFSNAALSPRDGFGLPETWPRGEPFPAALLRQELRGTDTRV